MRKINKRLTQCKRRNYFVEMFRICKRKVNKYATFLLHNTFLLHTD